jgi:HK97 family phage prohead protease
MKNLTLVCEAQVQLGKQADESATPSGVIEAVATTWGAREGADGRKFFYKPEGFAQWADEFSKSGKPLPMFLNHNDMGMPVGQWDEFMFDETGMTAKGKLYMNTVGGSDLYEVLKESPMMFGGVSVGAYADEYCYVKEDGTPMIIGSDDPYEDGYFQITKGGFREVSVVMYPNNPNANIQKLESCFEEDGSLNPRVLEKQLREAGVTKKDATTASSIFKKVLELRDAPKKLEETPIQGEPVAVVTKEADAILKALELRELAKALDKRLK